MQKKKKPNTNHLNPDTQSSSLSEQALWGGALVFLGAIAFSTKAIFVKLAYQYEVDTVSLLALRMLFSLPFFLIIAYWQSRKNLPGLTSRQYLGMAVLGILGYYCASMADFLGLQYISASLERVILFAYPSLVIILSAIFLKIPIQPRQYTALGLTYLGIILAFWGEMQVRYTQDFWWGGGLVLVAAFFYAMYLMGSGRLIPGIGSLRFNAYAMSAACGAVLFHTGWQNGWDLFSFDAAVYQYSWAIALISTVFASFLITAGIARIGAGNAAIISSIGPVSTIVLAYLYLNEELSLFQLFGTLLVLVGVVWVGLMKK